MATKKTTEVTPKTYALTVEQLQTLRDLANDLMTIRRTLEDLEGEDDPSKIMFNVGAMYNVSNKAETVIDELVRQCDDDDYDDY
jgi:prefoldin subunit 5